MRIRAAAAITGGALLLALAPGVGAPAAGPVAAARGCLPPSPWSGVDAANYRRTCQTCRIVGPRQVARGYGIHSTNPSTIALRYAQKAYPPQFRRAVYRGCLRGFRLRGRP